MHRRLEKKNYPAPNLSPSNIQPIFRIIGVFFRPVIGLLAERTRKELPRED
jgi:nitrate/nitrite transporter NarK